MPAIPLVAMGVSAYMSYKKAKAAGSAADTQNALVSRQSDLATQIGGFAKQQMSFGQPAMQKAMQHYMTLATGNRGAINAELAPDRAGVTDTYRGAEQGISARMAAGPERDRAIAQLYRQKAGQLGTMPFQARTAAFGGLQQMGEKATSMAGDLYGKVGAALGSASNISERAAEADANKWDAYGDMAVSGGKAAGQVYDWYKNRQNSKVGPYSSGYRWPVGMTPPYAG